MKLLLVNPHTPESFWNFSWSLKNILKGKKHLNSPLGLATLAALCPEDWQVEIVDENVDTLPENPDADIIGVCGMGVQFSRQKEILKMYRDKGYYMVAGGSYASLCPEEYTDLVDTVVAGEAEYIWPRFCSDYATGSQQKLYRETGEVDLADSPTPRYDLLNLKRYQTISMQFSRGCPYQCEFCDIIVMFGRKPRTKNIAQIEKELDVLRGLGVNNAFFVDDNLIGNKKMARELMSFLHDWQAKHNYKIHFGTEVSINLSQDDELMELCRKANMEWAFIGIETPDEESLKETKKLQNVRESLSDSIRRLHRNGMDVLAGFIVGFDNDTIKAFDTQYRFILESGIMTSMVGLLAALPKTPLYKRLKEEGRIIEDASGDNTKLGTNMVPKRMGYQEMVEAYKDLYYKLYTDKAVFTKISNKFRDLRDPIASGVKYSTREVINIIFNLIFKGIIPGGPGRIWYFIRSLMKANAKNIALIIQEWIVAISMKDYIKRHFIIEKKEVPGLLDAYIHNIKDIFETYVTNGSLSFIQKKAQDGLQTVSIYLKGKFDTDFFSKMTSHYYHVLKDTTSDLVINIEEFSEQQLKHIHELLDGLKSFQDRVSIKLSRKFSDLLDLKDYSYKLILVS